MTALFVTVAYTQRQNATAGTCQDGPFLETSCVTLQLGRKGSLFQYT